MFKNERFQLLMKHPVYGMPCYIFSICAIIILAAAYLKILPGGMIGASSLLLVIGVILGEIGDRIPIWKDWIGGGSILAFLGGAFLLHWGLLPPNIKHMTKDLLEEADFLNLFIAAIMVGSILTIDRETLLKSIAKYIPTLLIAIFCGTLLGIVAGMIVGVNPIEVVTYYALPTLGGGNGGGAVPLSQIYSGLQAEKLINAGSLVAGSEEAQAFIAQAKGEYYSKAIAILTISNIFAIISAALLVKIGKIFPKLTGGEGKLLKGQKEQQEDKKSQKAEITLKDVGAGMLLISSFYILGLLFSKIILPKIGSFSMHNLAYMVIFLILANSFGIIPEELKAGAKRFQSFISGRFLLLIMVGVGIANTDVGVILAILNFKTAFICLFIVLGAIIGAILGAVIFNFFFIESAISAGCCMCTRGDTGNLATLGGAKRMDLISFAIISTRVGGGIILVLASIFMSITA